MGLKNGYDLYPERVQERIQSEYKEKKWDEYHRQAVASANRQLADFENRHTSLFVQFLYTSHIYYLFVDSNLTDFEKLIKEDLEAKLEILTNAEKKFIDSGPIYDCILFHDGHKWLCCVDTSEQGNLENCPLLGEYSITHDYATLTSFDNLNFSINVHDDGDTLELVGLCCIFLYIFFYKF